MPVDRLENLAREAIGFKQVAELQQGRRIRGRFTAKIDADKSTDGLAVVDRIFDAFVRQAKALLGHLHAQHARHPNRWATSSFDFRIKRRDKLVQLAPWGHVVDLRQEAVAARQLFLAAYSRSEKLFCMIDGGP